LLEWETLSETNNYGFEVQRRPESDPQYQTLANSFIPGHGTTLEPHNYAYTDNTVTLGQWWYRLKQIDLYGTVHYTDGIQVDVVTDVGEDPLPEQDPLPTAFAMDQNYPNPFNPSTRIEYALPHESYVTLKIYNVLGQEVISLVDEQLPAGYFAVAWDGRTAAGGHLSSGVYFYRLAATDATGEAPFTSLKRLLLLK
jgi:hypothetical protein